MISLCASKAITHFIACLQLTTKQCDSSIDARCGRVFPGQVEWAASCLGTLLRKPQESPPRLHLVTHHSLWSDRLTRFSDFGRMSFIHCARLYCRREDPHVAMWCSEPLRDLLLRFSFTSSIHGHNHRLCVDAREVSGSRRPNAQASTTPLSSPASSPEMMKVVEMTTTLSPLLSPLVFDHSQRLVGADHVLRVSLPTLSTRTCEPPGYMVWSPESGGMPQFVDIFHKTSPV